MATQIGPKIGVDGEAEYRQQMARINSEAKALKAEMRELKTEVTNESNAQANAAKKAENLTNQINNQKTRVELLKQQLEKATDAYGEGSTQANTYREKLANAKTELNNLQRAQSDATTEVDDFAESEEEAGNNAVTMGDLISANLISQAIMDGLRRLAELGRQAAQALWGTVTGAAEYADEFLTMSTVTGISTDKLQEYAYMSELVDVSLDTMTGSMTKLTRQMSAARGGNEAAGEAFSRLGIRVTNADGTLRDSSEVFFEIIDALGQMEDGSERDALAMDVFGKSAQELNPLIAAGRKGIEGFAEEARNMGYVLDEETLNRLGELDDNFQRLSNLRTTVSNKLGAAMAPGVTRAVTKLLEYADRVDWDRIGNALGNLVDTAVDKLIEFADNADFDKLADGALKLGEGIVTGGTWILEHADEIIKLVSTIGGAMLLGKGVGAAKSTWDTVSGLFGGAKAATGAAAAAAPAAQAAGPAVGETVGAAAAPSFWSTVLAAGPLAAVVGGIGIGWKLGSDQVNEAKAMGTIDEGSIAEYEQLLRDLEAERARAQADFDNLALYGGDLTMASNELARIDTAILTAQENLAALQAQAAELEGSGEDAMASYADGITIGADKWLAPALRVAAGLVSAYFHHSEPDVGPMADDADWMPDMMAAWARQINDNSYLVRDAMAGLAFDLQDVLRPGLQAPGGGVNYGGVSVVIYGADGQSASDLYDEFAYRLNQDVLDREAVFA